MKKIIFLLFLTLLATTLKVKSQGCSDAGFCTIGALNQSGFKDSLKLNSAKIAFSYGIGDQRTIIIQTIPEVNFSFFKNNTLQLRLPYMFINGNLGNNSGIGDLTLSITQTFMKSDKIKLNGTIGIKIASDHSDDFLIPNFISFDNLPLPMPYQTSLGTNDLVLGASFGYMHWNFGIGFQHVIENKNKNRFLRTRWSGNSDAQKYFESNLLDRGDDALVRAERNFNLKKFSFTAGLLGIYRLQKDKINTLQNESIDVIGSDGLTLNLTGSAQYNLSSSFDLKFSFGTPVVVREARPDGLTRELVTTISFDYNF